MDATTRRMPQQILGQLEDHADALFSLLGQVPGDLKKRWHRTGSGGRACWKEPKSMTRVGSGCGGRCARRWWIVKVAVIGAGAVGAATALSLIERNGMCRDTVVLDRKTERANAVAIDMRYATPLSPTVDVGAGGYDALAGAALVIITAGVDEKTRGAPHRPDPQGRVRLLAINAKGYTAALPDTMPAAPRARLCVRAPPPH